MCRVSCAAIGTASTAADEAGNTSRRVVTVSVPKPSLSVGFVWAALPAAVMRDGGDDGLIRAQRCRCRILPRLAAQSDMSAWTRYSRNSAVGSCRMAPQEAELLRLALTAHESASDPRRGHGRLRQQADQHRRSAPRGRAVAQRRTGLSGRSQPPPLAARASASLAEVVGRRRKGRPYENRP